VPLPHEHPFYALVGRVASEWSHLEHILDLTIWDLAGVKREAGACITSQIMGVGPRCKAIIALGFMNNVPDQPILKGFRELMSTSYGAADDRNRIVHDPWFLDQGSNQPGQFRRMPYQDFHYGVVDVSKKEIDETIEKIRKLQKKASDLREKILAAVRTSP
jgi:hypothetical protein